ncbi:30S ribosomal protein S14 [Kribbella sp. NPDC051587]|uniref:30S ribosomal protein S14 n=1 Tax=Kribbella sp. NPDC051587 TaxID=3364119 RepID=UPI0037B173F1
MAKTSKIAKNEERKRIVARYADRRAELKRIIAAPASSFEERTEAQLKLQKLPRDASPIRIRNRDAADGRPRGYLRKAGISRVRFRTMAHRGELPGITKSSW